LDGVAVFGEVDEGEVRFSIGCSNYGSTQTYLDRQVDWREKLPKPKKTFVGTLWDYLRVTPFTHAQIYKAAQMDRRLFSKMISDVKYHPSRDVALALCLALQLSIEQTTDLLEWAVYALSKSSQRDLAITYCITNKLYDLMVVNGILQDLGEQLL
jgi:hypothetical protein